MPWPVDPQGPLARSIADLYWLMFGAAVIVLAIVVGALVVAGIRFRERPGHQARQYHGNNLLELIWTIVPTLMVISFSVLSFQRLTLVNDVDSGAAMTIKAEGQQWVWNFQYPSETRFQLNDANRFSDPAVAKGKQFFTTLACAGCHTIQGLTSAKIGPDLTHIASQKTPIGGIAGLDVNEANLIKWISNAPSLKPGVVMPVFSNKAGGPLDDATISSIVQFLLTLK